MQPAVAEELVLQVVTVQIHLEQVEMQAQVWLHL
jgi:hypothetical protein